MLFHLPVVDTVEKIYSVNSRYADFEQAFWLAALQFSTNQSA